MSSSPFSRARSILHEISLYDENVEDSISETYYSYNGKLRLQNDSFLQVMCAHAHLRRILGPEEYIVIQTLWVLNDYFVICETVAEKHCDKLELFG